MNKIALGIIDVQRGFMPELEGSRLGLAGFGELPVDGGQEVVPIINEIAKSLIVERTQSFTTQDWHPFNTAHFSESPNYVDTWPVHCVADTAGALLYPKLVLPVDLDRFKKGTTELLSGGFDDSYSGYNGKLDSGESLEEWLERQEIKKVLLGGLALDYCVGQTALDIKQKSGLDVAVILEATRSISEEGQKEMLYKFSKVGISVISAAEAKMFLSGRIK